MVMEVLWEVDELRRYLCRCLHWDDFRFLDDNAYSDFEFLRCIWYWMHNECEEIAVELYCCQDFDVDTSHLREGAVKKENGVCVVAAADSFAQDDVFASIRLGCFP